MNNTVASKPSKDALSRIRAAEQVVYSSGLLKKIRAVAKTGKVVRILTKEEQTEMEAIHGFNTGSYFMFHGAQLCINVRNCGAVVLFRC